MTRPDPDDVYARNAVDREQTAAHLARIAAAALKATRESELIWGHEYDRDRWWRLRCYQWWIGRTVPGEKTKQVASGRTFTRRGTERAWYRAYRAELNREPSQ